MPHLNEVLLDLFRRHEVDAGPDGDWIALPNQMRASATIVKETKEQLGKWSVQLDVNLEMAPGRTIIESFAGLGTTREEAAKDAFHNFVVNSFHVFLAAFFLPADAQVTQETWIIGGRPSRVTSGNVGIRSNPPIKGTHLLDWFASFQEKVQQKNFGRGHTGSGSTTLNCKASHLASKSF